MSKLVSEVVTRETTGLDKCWQTLFQVITAKTMPLQACKIELEKECMFNLRKIFFCLLRLFDAQNTIHSWRDHHEKGGLLRALSSVNVITRRNLTVEPIALLTDYPLKMRTSPRVRRNATIVLDAHMRSNIFDAFDHIYILRLFSKSDWRVALRNSRRGWNVDVTSFTKKAVAPAMNTRIS